MKLTVVFEYYEAKETYSRISVLRGSRNLQSYLVAVRSLIVWTPSVMSPRPILRAIVLVQLVWHAF